MKNTIDKSQWNGKYEQKDGDEEKEDPDQGIHFFVHLIDLFF
jgi:hypothetical protein